MTWHYKPDCEEAALKEKSNDNSTGEKETKKLNGTQVFNCKNNTIGYFSLVITFDYWLGN